MSDPERSFVDTNVWLYAFVTGQDGAKMVTATGLVKREQIVVSVQVINEVCINLIKKAGYAEADVRALIDSFFAKYAVMPLDRQSLVLASELRERHSLSYWDSTIVASALNAGAAVLYSEDMQHGLVINGSLRIVNPF